MLCIPYILSGNWCDKTEFLAFELLLYPIYHDCDFKP